ncbi:MAG: hypothetical protein JXR40_12115 [Pontiellaceae bacterium]|nr:hypothetical protein [Pontiellaceae bacterium]
MKLERVRLENFRKIVKVEADVVCHRLDLAVDRICRAKPFAFDEECLFELYEELTYKEKFV